MQIALFTSDPEVNNTSIPLDVVKLSSNLNYNYHVTPVSLKADTFPGGWNKKVRSGISRSR